MVNSPFEHYNEPGEHHLAEYSPHQPLSGVEVPVGEAEAHPEAVFHNESDTEIEQHDREVILAVAFAEGSPNSPGQEDVDGEGDRQASVALRELYDVILRENIFVLITGDWPFFGCAIPN